MTEHRQLDPKTLKRQAINARFMDKQTFDLLVENVRTDGVLTGAVTCYQPTPEADIEILSGHHRVMAAIEAGLVTIDVIVITVPIPLERLRAIQLSHNAITGKDDLGVLAEMYQSLDIDAKAFSGLTDDFFGSLDKFDLGGISSGAVRYQDLTFHFLPDDLASLEDHIKHVARSKRTVHHAARFADFDTVFEAVVLTKLRLNIQNSALALLTMAELAIERLNEMDEEDDETETGKAGETEAIPAPEAKEPAEPDATATAKAKPAGRRKKGDSAGSHT